MQCLWLNARVGGGWWLVCITDQWIVEGENIMKKDIENNKRSCGNDVVFEMVFAVFFFTFLVSYF